MMLSSELLLADSILLLRRAAFSLFDSAIWINSADGSQGLRYEELISPLVKAMQEQQAQIETLKAEVATLKGI